MDLDSAVATIRHQLEAFRKALHRKTVPFPVKRKIVETFVNAVVVSLERGSTLQVTLKETIPFRPESADRQPELGQERNRVTLGRGKEQPGCPRNSIRKPCRFSTVFPFHRSQKP